MGRKHRRGQRKAERAEKQRQRLVKAGANVDPKKQPKLPPDADSNGRRVEWSFDIFDHGMDWRDNDDPQITFCEIGQHLKSYSSMTWNEIMQSGNRDHSMAQDALCKPARDRLREMRLDDFEEFWRFRFGGKERLWGVKMGHVFRVIWWDPHHQVYPVEKKHT